MRDTAINSAKLLDPQRDVTKALSYAERVYQGQTDALLDCMAWLQAFENYYDYQRMLSAVVQASIHHRIAVNEPPF